MTPTRPGAAALRLGAVGILASLILVAVACASAEQPTVDAADARAWARYRGAVLPAVTEVLGGTDGLAERCDSALERLPEPRFEINPRPTLRACALGDFGTARQLAHQIIDDIATNQAALAKGP